MTTTAVRSLAVAAAVSVGLLTACGSSATHAHGSLCRADEPAAWRTAASGPALFRWPSTADHTEFTPVDADSALVERSRAGRRDVLLAGTQGPARVVLRLPAGHRLRSADGDARWLVVVHGVQTQPESDSYRDVSVDRVDRRTGSVERIAGVGAVRGRTSVDTVVYADGHVWWAVGSRVRPTLQRYDLGSGRVTTVGRAPNVRLGPPVLAGSPDGVYWQYGRLDDTSYHFVRAVRLPVPAAVAAARPAVGDLLTDGAAYVWTSGAHTLRWLGKGSRTARSIDLRDGGDAHLGAATSVTGPLVSVTSGDEAGRRSIVDLRTGAVLVDNPDLGFGTGRDGTLFFTSGPDDDTTLHAARLTTLPPLRC